MYDKAYNDYYRKCRLAEHPKLLFEGKYLSYTKPVKRLIGWVPENYAQEGNLLLVWDTEYDVIKVFKPKTTRHYIDKLQEPILC